MPRLEGAATNPQLVEDAKRSHLIRLRHDLAQYRTKLESLPEQPTKDHPMPEQEAQLLTQQLQKWDRQLFTVEHPETTPQQEDVSGLKQELASLRTAFADVLSKFTTPKALAPVDAEVEQPVSA